VETKKGDDRGPLIVFNPLCSVLTPLKIMNLVIASPLHQLCILRVGGGGIAPLPPGIKEIFPHTRR